MNDFLIAPICKFTNILLAPLYFHFGHHWLFIETMVVLTNIVDTLGLYFIMFVFIALVSFYRNSTFQIFCKNFFKNYSLFFNILPLSCYISFFYNSFFSLVSTLVDAILFFFKKK